MKAARLVKQRAPLEIVQLPDPAPAPDEVIVQIDADNQRLTNTIVAQITTNLSRSGEPTQ